MNNKNILCSWSGGKDSCYALMKVIREDYVPKVLLNVLNEEGIISRSHGIPANILQAQAKALGLPIYLISSSWSDYERNFINALHHLSQEHKLSQAVFGDIDLQEHRDWEEKVCSKAELEALLPLWQQDRKWLVMEMMKAGIKTIIVSCNEKMGEQFLGNELTPALIDELELLGVDACGENGEFHTLVLDCPLFTDAVKVHVTGKIKYDKYWFSELQLEEKQRE